MNEHGREMLSVFAKAYCVFQSWQCGKLHLSCKMWEQDVTFLDTAVQSDLSINLNSAASQTKSSDYRQEWEVGLCILNLSETCFVHKMYIHKETKVISTASLKPLGGSSTSFSDWITLPTKIYSTRTLFFFFFLEQVLVLYTQQCAVNIHTL